MNINVCLKLLKKNILDDMDILRQMLTTIGGLTHYIMDMAHRIWTL